MSDSRQVMRPRGPQQARRRTRMSDVRTFRVRVAAHRARRHPIRIAERVPAVRLLVVPG